jgi:aspartate aminotransferase
MMQAEDILTASKLDKEYLPITGLPEFTKSAAKLAYGAESEPLNANAVRPLFPPIYYKQFIKL